MTIPVHFATTRDDVRIAYAVHGDGPPLLFVRGWITHLDLMWDEASFCRFFEALGHRFRVVRFDARGNGLSQRDVGPPDLDAFVRDTEAVADACNLESFVAWGSCFGGPIAIAYAARHPERVSRVILEGTYPTWTDLRTAKQRRAAVDVIRMLSTSPELATTAASYLTDPEPESRHEKRAMRLINSVDPEYLAELYVFAARVDVRADVEALAMPALVMHVRDSQVYPCEGARLLASTIARARYVELPGHQHNPWEGDANAALAAMCAFCAVAPVEVATATSDRVAIVMFTDAVASTDVADRLGDVAATTMRHAHERIVTDAVAAYDGTVVKFLGDGTLARFATATAALHAGAEILRAVRAYNDSDPECPLGVRVGLNAGEPIEEDGDVHGTAVNLAARVCAWAEGNTLLLTAAVRHLAAGKGFHFLDRGAAKLKGFAEEVELYELLPRPSGD